MVAINKCEIPFKKRRLNSIQIAYYQTVIQTLVVCYIVILPKAAFLSPDLGIFLEDLFSTFS